MRTIEQALAPYKVTVRASKNPLAGMDLGLVEAIGNACRWAMNYGSSSVVNPYREENRHHSNWAMLDSMALDALGEYD